MPLVALLTACSSDPDSTGSSGGATSSGGSGGTSSGGTTAISSGGAAHGGASQGGTLASGGTSSSGGANPGTGGAQAGSNSLGGAPAASGGTTQSSNGGTSSGGRAGDGGGAHGGSTASGGTSSAGGASGAGAGGSSATGGGTGYSPCPAAGSPCAILPLGDSITEGYASSGGGYRVEIFRQAVKNGKNITFVGSLQNGPASVENKPFPKQHEGHGGFTIDSDGGHSGISGSITDQALSNYHPHIVLLMIGTNDINGNVDINNAPNRLGKLIDDITTRSPSTLVVVATIIPIANDGTNQRVQAYNAALPALVNTRASAGKHVVLLDNYAAFSKVANYKTAIMSDYLHPNDSGYAVLGQSFYSAVAAALP